MKLGSVRRDFELTNKNESLLVTDTEIANPDFIRDGRAACNAQNKTAEQWVEHVHDLYRDYTGLIFDGEGHEIILNMEVFEVPSIRECFRDFACTPCPPEIIPRVRVAARPRVRVLLTVMRASFPLEAENWGVREAANDNQAQKHKLKKP